MPCMGKENSAKHHKSPSHQAACVFFLSSCVSASGVVDSAAPAVAELEEFCDNIEAGQVTCQSQTQSKMISWLAKGAKALDHAGCSG